MSKAFIKWKEKREWGLLHRFPTPRKRMTMKNYKRWKRALGRHERWITKCARDSMSQIMPNEFRCWIKEDV